MGTHAHWDGIAFAALDYEIVAVAAGGASPAAVGNFRDVHVRVDDAVFRYVSGYLSFEADPAEPEVRIHSHGRQVAALRDAEASVAVTFRGSAILEAGRLILPDAGLGIIPGGHWQLDGNVLLLGDRDDPARAVMVHGPARAKIDARMALADSLYAVGGRRG